MLENKITRHSNCIELCLVEEKFEGTPIQERKITIPLQGEIPRIPEHVGKIEGVSRHTILSGLGLFPSFCIKYEFESTSGAKTCTFGYFAQGTTYRVYLFWTEERAEWLAIQSDTEYLYTKKWENVDFSGPYSLNDFYIAQLLEAYRIKPESVESKAVPKMRPAELEELAKADN